jgi:transposase-like protein
MAGRKIRDQEDAFKCLRAAKAAAPRLTQAQWARKHGIDGRSLHAWDKNLSRRRNGRKRNSSATQSGLVELISRTPFVSHGYRISTGQFSIEVNEKFNEGTLIRLLRVVSAC